MKVTKVLNVVKLVGLGVVFAALVGCATWSSIANKSIDNTSEGLMYGANNGRYATASELCGFVKDNKNKDERCSNPSDYQAVYVIARMGYSDGQTGMWSLAPKSMDLGGEGCRSGSSSCTYLKVKVEANKLGTVLEVVPKGVCHWGGMPRIGSTVCPSLGYDASRDFNGVVR